MTPPRPARTKKVDIYAPSPHAYMPSGYRKSDVYALKALQLGVATSEQQKNALAWIINICAGTYDMSFRPGGPEGQRETDFAEGKRHVGNQLVKLLNLDATLLSNIE